MSSNRKNSFVRSVTFRLTAWYVLLFTLVSLAFLAIANAELRSFLRNRTDEDLEEDLKELGAVYLARGVPALQAEFDREANSTGSENIFLALAKPDGSTLASSNLDEWKGVQILPEGFDKLPKGGNIYQTIEPTGHEEDARVACEKLADDNYLCMGVSLEEEDEMMELFQRVLGAAMLGMLVSGGIMGWLLVRRAMSGVERVTGTAIRIGRDRLGERVSVGHEGREIEDLAVAFNGMLERIDALVKSLREVTDNLAHDLRSPITRLRGTAETTLAAKSNLDEYKEFAGTVVEEADALVRLLNTMLEIAETDAGMASIHRDPVDVAGLVRETHELFHPAAEDQGLKLEIDLAPGELLIRGDVARLQRVMANLLDNAIKNTPRGGTIRLSAAETAGHAVVTVSDTGVGIHAKDLPRIFERFYRGDSSRSQPGSGLGLSLSLSIIRAHGGEITVQSEVGKGSTFTILLPLP